MMTETIPTPSVLFQDQDLLVISKPAGLLSVPDGYDSTLPHLKTVLEPKFGTLWLVHRLDKGTSGVMLLARHADAHRALNQAFRERNVRKIYHGLVTPPPPWEERIFGLPLKVNADRKHRTRVDLEEGKPAWTGCKVIMRRPQAVLMEITIKTGITHQIRAHLRANELMLVGESLYNAGLKPPTLTAPRMMLHAREITFRHPISCETLTFTAPYPDDFHEIYTRLRTTINPDGAP
jgi:tRNA pseudouridine32 synthase/23S rRNA pseudouridine746 synthase